jgi:hypothetical protein
VQRLVRKLPRDSRWPTASAAIWRRSSSSARPLARARADRPEGVADALLTTRGLKPALGLMSKSVNSGPPELYVGSPARAVRSSTVASPASIRAVISAQEHGAARTCPICNRGRVNRGDLRMRPTAMTDFAQHG